MALGWGDSLQQELERLRGDRADSTLRPARVVVEHRGAYQLIAEDGPCSAELTGRLRHQALDKLDLPAVGDWVVLQSEGRIDAVLPRKSAFVRKAAGDRTEPQVIAANIDRVFIVTSANTEFNPRRIERYIAAIWESGASPVLVLNKTDLCEDVDGLIDSLDSAAIGLPVARVSALAHRGADQLSPFLGPQTTVALVGSSGVGKSTLANWLLGRDALDTGGIRLHDAHGRHTTTHRELLALPTGGALIDTPGMRELGLLDDAGGLDASFPDVAQLAEHCRFRDCAHEGEPGCAVTGAVAEGRLPAERLEAYRKLVREIEAAERKRNPALAGRAKARWKAIHKAQRQRAKIDPKQRRDS